ERNSEVFIYRLIRSSPSVGKDKQWHSAWVRVRHMGISACVWRDYAMIRRLSAVLRTRPAGRREIVQCLPHATVLGMSVTQILGRGGHSDASAAPVVERAHGRRARWTSRRDRGGSGRAVSPRAQRSRGGREVCLYPSDQWLHRLYDAPQCP